ncbi:hypothetical protein IWZ03DRAFT_390048 [Phyllosticta citriasiana]|uniref:Secreted protein n=1 Tax=Phyllosticta citriasiana TaxID=595635 RepID=A0ABR1K882_9PEZI
MHVRIYAGWLAGWLVGWWARLFARSLTGWLTSERANQPTNQPRVLAWKDGGMLACLHAGMHAVSGSSERVDRARKRREMLPGLSQEGWMRCDAMRCDAMRWVR